VIQNDLGFYLHRSIQTTKSTLSSNSDSLFQFNDSVVQIEASLTRTQFEAWINEELTKIRGCAERLLAQACVSPSDVDHVFLTGGSSLVPAVRRIFESIFGDQKLTGGSEFTSVAQGLALLAMERLHK
jgi:hypothetical chaperone protein